NPQHHLILVSRLPVRRAAFIDVAQSGAPLRRVGERGKDTAQDWMPASVAPLLLQIQQDLERIVEQKRFDLGGHANIADHPFSIKAYGEEARLRCNEAVLDVHKAQARIRIRLSPPIDSRNSRVDFSAGALTHVFPGLTNIERYFYIP